jgi:hypothetical protein
LKIDGAGLRLGLWQTNTRKNEHNQGKNDMFKEHGPEF